MAKDVGYRDIVERRPGGGAFHGELLDVVEEDKVLEEESRNMWCSIMFLLEIAVVDREFSNIEVWAIRCCGDGLGPFQEIQRAFESDTSEDVLSASGGPRFRDQCATSERGLVGAEVIKDFVDDLDGYVRHVSVTLAGSGEL